MGLSILKTHIIFHSAAVSVVCVMLLGAHGTAEGNSFQRLSEFITFVNIEIKEFQNDCY